MLDHNIDDIYMHERYIPVTIYFHGWTIFEIGKDADHILTLWSNRSLMGFGADLDINNHCKIIGIDDI